MIYIKYFDLKLKSRHLISPIWQDGGGAKPYAAERAKWLGQNKNTWIYFKMKWQTPPVPEMNAWYSERKWQLPGLSHIICGCVAFVIDTIKLIASTQVWNNIWNVDTQDIQNILHISISIFPAKLCHPCFCCLVPLWRFCNGWSRHQDPMYGRCHHGQTFHWFSLIWYGECITKTRCMVVATMVSLFIRW